MAIRNEHIYVCYEAFHVQVELFVSGCFECSNHKPGSLILHNDNIRHFQSYERSMDAENAVREIAQKPAFTVMNWTLAENDMFAVLACRPLAWLPYRLYWAGNSAYKFCTFTFTLSASKY